MDRGAWGVAVHGVTESQDSAERLNNKAGSLAEACELLFVACGIWFPAQESNPRPLLWEHGVLATGPPGKPLPLHSETTVSTWAVLFNILRDSELLLSFTVSTLREPPSAPLRSCQYALE